MTNKKASVLEPDTSDADAAASNKEDNGDSLKPDTSDTDAVQPKTGDTPDSVKPDMSAAVSANKEDSSGGTTGRRWQLSLSLRGVVTGLVVVVLVVAVGALAWLYVGARGKLGAEERRASDAAHAEKVALDYAANAAAMKFDDLSAWKVRLVAGTSPELKERLTKAATSMEQILVPLQWSSTAEPLAAKVRSEAGGVYVVDSFVSVQTKTLQAPEPLQSTATYSLTIDSNKNWQITDVGGVGAAVNHH